VFESWRQDAARIELRGPLSCLLFDFLKLRPQVVVR
jgi:hypothetical protein